MRFIHVDQYTQHAARSIPHGPLKWPLALVSRADETTVCTAVRGPVGCVWLCQVGFQVKRRWACGSRHTVSSRWNGRWQLKLTLSCTSFPAVTAGRAEGKPHGVPGSRRFLMSHAWKHVGAVPALTSANGASVCETASRCQCLLLQTPHSHYARGKRIPRPRTEPRRRTAAVDASKYSPCACAGADSVQRS